MDRIVIDKETIAEMNEWMQVKGYSSNTIKQYNYTLGIISNMYKEVSNENLRKILKGFKHQNQRAVLCLINNYCFDKGMLFNLLIPKVKVKPRKTPDILSIDEIKIMIASAPKPYDLAIRCIFNMGAGLRVSEMIKLSWNHIRWADWLADKSRYGVAVIKSGKGSKDRVVNIPSNLMNDLYKYAEQENRINEYGMPNGGMMFPMGKMSRYKKKLQAYDMEKWKAEFLVYAYGWFRYNIIQQKCEKALGKKIKIHSLRHSRATYLYEVEKVPIERIQLLLGHSNLATTMIYTKVNPISTFDMIKNTKEV